MSKCFQKIKFVLKKLVPVPYRLFEKEISKKICFCTDPFYFLLLLVGY